MTRVYVIGSPEWFLPNLEFASIFFSDADELTFFNRIRIQILAFTEIKISIAGYMDLNPAGMSIWDLALGPNLARTLKGIWIQLGFMFLIRIQILSNG